MKRRTALLTPWLAASAAAQTAPTTAAAPAAAAAELTDATRPALKPIDRLAAAWQQKGSAAELGASKPDSGSFLSGVLQIDWEAGQVNIVHAVPLPSRAHGLLALPDGGWLTLANRPGRWLLRCDPNGAPQLLQTMAGETRTLNGHAALSPCGRWLFTTETDPHSGQGWLGQRELQSLALVAEFPSHGVDPHHLLWAANGSLMVANGGIARDALGRKQSDRPMTSSLVQIDARGGRLLGRWQLADPQLSIRHLAWAAGAAGGNALLGVALQAEHESPAQRLEAPTLALWDGAQLRLPTDDTRGGGYAGDIAAGPGGGFVISAQKQGRALWWQPRCPELMTVVAEVTEPCALVSSDDGAGICLGAGRGVARWHSQQGAQMLRWPAALAPDNHWVRLHSTEVPTG